MKDKEKKINKLFYILSIHLQYLTLLSPLSPAHQIKDSKELFEVRDPIKRNIKTTQQLALFLVELTSNLARNQMMVFCLIL
jgi:hypothetical protein